MGDIYIGCAGWALNKDVATEFPEPGTHLERYARRFDCVEINSCFYRPHQKKTYERWALSTPESFRFALKVPKTITHEARLADAGDTLARYLDETSGLGEKRAVLLVQLPPSLALDEPVARAFFAEFRRRYAGRLAIEPRHVTWFGDAAERIYDEYGLARVAADPPAPGGAAAEAGGVRDWQYVRLHGTPRIYYSEYPPEKLREVAGRLTHFPESWCIFDNTAMGFAIPNALETRKLLEGRSISDHPRGSLAS